MFDDRAHAATLLAQKLLPFRDTVDCIVGLARGGVAVSSVLSKTLGIPHEALMVKKISRPDNPELATGAVVPEGQSLSVGGKTVILTDDGAATGATMTSAITWVKSHEAKKIIVALPVAPPEVVARLRKEVSELIVLDVPVDFRAVGQFYKNFPQLSDEEMVELLV